MNDTLAMVAATGLQTMLRPHSKPLDDAAFMDVRRRAVDHRLVGLVAAAIASGSLAVTPRQRDLAVADHIAAATWVLQLDQTLLDITHLFSTEGIPFRVLKGAAVAHLDYPDLADRCYGDVDIAVPAADFGRAGEVLRSHGGVRRFPEPRRGFDRAFSKGACFTLPDAVEVDLHRTLALGWFGLALVSDDLFAGSEEFTVGDHRLSALEQPTRLVHACLHAALGDAEPKLLALRDVAQMVLHCDDIEPSLRLAERWRCEVVVADAIVTSWASLGLMESPPLVIWAAGYRADRRSASRLARYRSDRRLHAGLALGGVSAVPGLLTKMRYLRAVLTPRRDDTRLPTRTRLRHGVQAGRARLRR